jgi:hypothetical protein
MIFKQENSSSTTSNNLLANLNGISVMTGFVAAVVVVLFILKKFIKNERVHRILRRIMRYILWNFVIRYFQSVYLEFNYASIVALQRSSKVSDKVLSAFIIILQITVVGFIGLILTWIPRPNLRFWARYIGNLYNGLDIEVRNKCYFSLIFYL